MAIAKIDLICKKCGGEFEVRKSCTNRAAADSYEAWAVDHIIACPACTAKARRAEQTAAIAEKLAAHKLELPTITGVSDKQISFADDLRTKYLAANLDKIEMYAQIIESLTTEDIKARYAEHCAAQGKTIEAALAETYEAYHLTTVKLLLEEDSAHKIIDACRY